jgi:hypothetical protein
VIVLFIVPYFHYHFLKKLDQRDYDLYIGENARLPSFNLIDVDAGRENSEIDNSRLSSVSASKSFKSDASGYY